MEIKIRKLTLDLINGGKKNTHTQKQESITTNVSLL